MTLATIVVVAFAISAITTGLWRNALVRHSVLDHANERSSHTGSIPRAGGVVFCVLAVAVAVIGASAGLVDTRFAIVLAIGGGLTAIVGFIDDVRPLPPLVRLLAHAAAAAVLVIGLSPLPESLAGVDVVIPAVLLQMLLGVAVIWSINLWNFMDGIDGLAASQASVVFATTAGVAAVSGGPMALPAAMTGLVLGFLVWNVSTRRLFMGDAGSGFLGFAVLLTIAVLWDRGDLPIWSGVIVTATMWVDATVTVVRRTLRGLRPWEAHRSHAYQHLVRRGWTHRRVSGGYLLLQIGVMCPMAIAAIAWPCSAPWLAGLVTVVMVVVAAWLGAGSEPEGR